MADTFDPKDPFYTQGYEPATSKNMYVELDDQGRSFAQALAADTEATVRKHMAEMGYEGDLLYANGDTIEDDRKQYWENMQSHVADETAACKEDIKSFDVVVPVIADGGKYKFGTKDDPHTISNNYGDGEMFVKILNRDHAQDIQSNAVRHQVGGYADYECGESANGATYTNTVSDKPALTLGAEGERSAVFGHDDSDAPVVWLNGKWNVYALRDGNDMVPEVVLQPASDDAKVLAVVTDYAQVNNADIPVVADMDYTQQAEASKSSIADRINSKAAALDGGAEQDAQY